VAPLQKIWESPVPAAKPAGPTLEAFRPAIDRGRIFVLDLQGTVQALDASTLQSIWQAKTEDLSFFFQTTNGLTVLPVDPLLAVKETVLAVGGKILRAFDPVTGAALWSAPSPDGDGVVHQIVLDGNKVYSCETKGRVTARDERTGRLLWSVRPGASASGVMTDRSGTTGGGLFYSRIGAEGGRVVVQPAGDPGSLFAYDSSTGKQAWKVVDATYVGYLKGRVLLEVGNGMAVFGDSSGVLACHDLADGKVRWKLSLGVPVEGVLTAADRVIAATADQIVLYSAKTGRKEWIAAPDLNQPFSREKDMRVGATSLAAKGKWLVVGSANAVSILDLATGQVKDQVKSDAPPPAQRPGGRFFPFGKSFASVALGPEGIFWGVPVETGCRWTLLR
jgi:outer membrane protein assembly factor BamB